MFILYIPVYYYLYVCTYSDILLVPLGGRLRRVDAILMDTPKCAHALRRHNVCEGGDG